MHKERGSGPLTLTAEPQITVLSWSSSFPILFCDWLSFRPEAQCMFPCRGEGGALCVPQQPPPTVALRCETMRKLNVFFFPQKWSVCVWTCFHWSGLTRCEAELWAGTLSETIILDKLAACFWLFSTVWKPWYVFLTVSSLGGCKVCFIWVLDLACKKIKKCQMSDFVLFFAVNEHVKVPVHHSTRLSTLSTDNGHTKDV